MTETERKACIVSLMTRYCQLGRLLEKLGPRTEAGFDLDMDDPAAVAEAKVVVAEMAKTQSKIDALLAVARRDRVSRN